MDRYRKSSIIKIKKRRKVDCFCLVQMPLEQSKPSPSRPRKGFTGRRHRKVQPSASSPSTAAATSSTAPKRSSTAVPKGVAKKKQRPALPRTSAVETRLTRSLRALAVAETLVDGCKDGGDAETMDFDETT